MTLRLLSGWLGMLLWATAQAHHSTANFDRDRATTVRGTVSHVSFSNPHSVIEMDVPENGTSRHYTIFATSKVVLLRYGWRPDRVKAGDTLTVMGYPDRNEPGFLYLEDVQFADGTSWKRSDVLE